MADLIQIRRDKGSVWQSVNPTLALAEIGIVLDDNGAMTNPIQFKVGNGSTAWNNLPMQNGSAINKIKVNGVELTIDGNRAVDVIVKASGSLGTDVSGSAVAFVDSAGVVRSSSVNIANTSGSSTSSLITQAAVSESIADVRKDIDLLSGSVSGSFAAVDERVTGIEENIENNYAKIDGSYDSMAVGVAKNLEGDQEVEDTFISRTAGGTAEIANGVAQILEVKGNSQVWNQMFPGWRNGNKAVSASVSTILDQVSNYGTVDHKYFIAFNYWGDNFSGSVYAKNLQDDYSDITFTVTSAKTRFAQVYTCSQVNTFNVFLTREEGTFNIDNTVQFDLTLLGIDNLTTVEEVEAWLAENIGPLEYYPYNAGTVLNNSMEGIETTGFNLLDPATGKAQILGAYDDASDNLYGITGTHGTITFKAADGTEETVTPDADGKFQLTVPGELTVANAGADCAVFFWKDGSKTDYEEYDKNVSYLDVKNIYGKLNGSGNLVQVFPDGMAGVNGVKDVLHIENDKPVARKKIGRRAYLSGDESNTSVVSDGSTYTYYKLDTEQVYTDLVYINSSHFADNTPVTLPVTYTVNNWGIENILPKNISESVSTAPADLLCRYAIDAVAQLNAHSNQIEDLYEVKADKKGTYPGLVAGNLVDTSGVGTEQQFVFRHTGGEEHVADKTQAVIQKYMGKSLVWNQLIKDFRESSNWIAGGNDITVVGDKIHIKFASASSTNAFGVKSSAFFAGHRYCLLMNNENAVPLTAIKIGSATSVDNSGSTLSNETPAITAAIPVSSESAGALWFWPSDETKLEGDFSNIFVIDLTLMFGAGNEPSTVEEFKAMFSQPYYEYNEGTIISNNVDSIETVGFNQWDEEWELGSYDASGRKIASSDSIRSKNMFVCLPYTSYYWRIPDKANGSYMGFCYFYDISGAFISQSPVGPKACLTVTTPSNARFVAFALRTEYGTTYNHDICINISDPAKNGTYEPYEKHELDLSWVKEIKDTEGVKLFEDGMKSVGTAFDEVGKNKAVKRIRKYVFDGSEPISEFLLNDGGTASRATYNTIFNTTFTGTRDAVSIGAGFYSKYNGGYYFDLWAAGFAAVRAYIICVPSSVAKTSDEMKEYLKQKYDEGNPLVVYYELAEPIEVEYDEKNLTYPVFGGGTEAILPGGVDEKTGVPETTPFRAQIFYSKDYLSQLNNMPQDYISVGSMTNFYTELASKLGAAISKSISVSASFNSSDQKYDYVITISDISGSI